MEGYFDLAQGALSVSAEVATLDTARYGAEIEKRERRDRGERERDRDRDRDREEREEREPGKDAAAASCIQVCVGFINVQLLVGVNAFMRDCPLARVCVLTAPCRVWG